MERTKIKQLLTSGEAGADVTVAGWVKSSRVSKKIAFLVLNDGSCQSDLQVIVDGELDDFAEMERLKTGASAKIQGTLVESPGKGQKWEVHAKSVTVLGEADVNAYPLQKKGHSLEFLREIAHLRARTNTFGAVFRVANCLSRATHNYFQEKGFLWAHTPILTPTDAEGAGETFAVSTLDFGNVPRGESGDVDFGADFFGKKAQLAVTGQLEAEFMACALGDVYTFGPTFRAENSNTQRHLAEFWMVEPEMAFADLGDVMNLAEGYIKFLLQKVLEHCREELAFFEKFYKNQTVASLEALAQSKFSRITYSEAIDLLQNSGHKFEFTPVWEDGLQTEHERWLAEHLGGPVFVTDYPKDIKAFYMRCNDDGKTVAAMDLIVPRVGELIGGSQREERLEVLERRMEEMNVPSEDLQWYLDLRRFGSVPHGGFGLGFERMVMFVTGMANIRDVIPCPRTPNHLAF